MNASPEETGKSAEPTGTTDAYVEDGEISQDSVRGSDMSDVDEIDRAIEENSSDWQKSASKIVKEYIKPDSRYKLKKFIENEILNKIRLDKSLNHLPKSIGCYVDATNGMLTPSGKNAKERVKSSEEEEAAAARAADTQKKKPRKVRKCPPRCVICCAIADPQNKESKISQTTIYCSTCLVHLCTKKIGNRKTTCFERFHQLPDLTQLSREKRINVDGCKSNRKRKRSEEITK